MLQRSLFFLLLFSLLSPGVHAQIKKNTRVKKTPRARQVWVPHFDLQVQEGYPKERDFWVAFSDRADNNTYIEPGSDTKLKVLDFLQPCYIVRQKGAYVQLIKYDDKITNNSPKGIIKDRKKAEYLGWILKSRLLLWRVALKNSYDQSAVKTVTALSGTNYFEKPDLYFRQDSIRIFASPDLKKERPGLLAFKQLLYVYKASEDHKIFLVGRSSQVSTEATGTQILGWIPGEVLQYWGTRAAMMPNPAITANTSSALFTTDRIKGIAAGNHPEYPPVKPAPIDELFPLQQRTKLTDTTTRVKTGLLADILDRSDNRILNVAGESVSYESYLQLRKNTQHLNIVFVIDGGAQNARYYPSILNIIQHLQISFDRSGLFRYYRFGGVVYKDNNIACNGTEVLPPTSDYPAAIRFFQSRQEALFSCNDDNEAQAVFKGITNACTTLLPYKNETNVVVLIGGAGNDPANTYNWDKTVSALSAVKARLLVFQTHNATPEIYSDFVLQAKELVLRSALNISLLQKKQVVELSNTIPEPRFTTAQGDSGIYRLDYPQGSMIPGIVLFPAKNRAKSMKMLESYVDTLLHQAKDANDNMLAGMQRIFNTYTGNMLTHVDTGVGSYPQSYRSKLPESFLRSFTGYDNIFYLPAYSEVNTACLPDSNEAKHLKKGLVLSDVEYDQMIFNLRGLAGTKDLTSLKRRKIYRYYKRYLRDFKTQKQLTAFGKVKRMSLSTATEMTTGFYAEDPDFQTFRVVDIRNPQKISREALHKIIGRFKARLDFLVGETSNPDIKFESAGNMYYWIAEPF